MNEPYHSTDVGYRITTAASIGTALDHALLKDLLTVTETSAIGDRHASSGLSLWLGNQSDPASVVTVCERLIDALAAIRDHNAALVDLTAIDAVSPAEGHEVVAE